jgi:A/G-specific adenine glycosylase
MWEYPGGKQELGETLEETLQREILEELNTEIDIGDLLGVYVHAYTHYKVTLHAFQCRLNTKNLVLNYHTDSAWVKISSLGNYPMGKIDRQISQQLENTYLKQS